MTRWWPTFGAETNRQVNTIIKQCVIIHDYLFHVVVVAPQNVLVSPLPNAYYMLRPLHLPIFNGPNRLQEYVLRSKFCNSQHTFSYVQYSHWQHVLLTHLWLGVVSRPPFRRLQNQEAHTDKVSQIRVTDVTWQSGEWYTEMSTSQGGELWFMTCC